MTKSGSKLYRWLTLFFIPMVVISSINPFFVSAGFFQFFPSKPAKIDRGTVIGIDIGTTNLRVAVFRNGNAHVIANERGSRITPSFVAFTDHGKLLVGDAAKDQAVSNPENTVYAIKRLIGRSWDDKMLQSDLKNYPFKVFPKDGKPFISLNVKGTAMEFAPEQILAKMLTKMKEVAEEYLCEIVTHAVVTVPANFNDAQRQATKDAGIIAGLNVLRIINEPTAVAIAYGLRRTRKQHNVLVYDMGGGTFDVSLISMEYGVFTVLATAGDMHLGGEDFDQRLVEYFVELYLKKSKKDCTQDKRAMALLKQEAEKAKRALSSRMSVHVEIKGFFNGDNFSEEISRDTFEGINMDLFEKTMKSVQQVLRDACCESSSVDDVIMVGGSTQIPKINNLIRAHFNGNRPSYSNSKGKGKSSSFIPCAHICPTNPDEVVAYGAAVLPDQKYADYIDIVPFTLSIKTATDDVITPKIWRSTSVPTKETQIISTVEDNQETIFIQVYESESSMKNQKMLGAFELRNIPASPRGVPQIKVSFEIDVDGILHVSAHNKATGKPIAINKYRLSQVEFNRMIDKIQLVKDTVDAINVLKEYLHDLKSELNDRLGRILSSYDKKRVLDAVNQGLEWLELNETTASAKHFLKMIENDLNPILAQIYGRTYGFDEDEYLLDDGRLLCKCTMDSNTH